MLYRFLCNALQREGAKPNPDLAFGLFCYVPLHKIWYGIYYMPILPHTRKVRNSSKKHNFSMILAILISSLSLMWASMRRKYRIW